MTEPHRSPAHTTADPFSASRLDATGLGDAVAAAARTTLVDAIEALGPYRRAVVVVGAQAVYLRTGAADLDVAPSTSDGDIAVDPDLLATTADERGLGQRLTAAGFVPLRDPNGDTMSGSWGKPVAGFDDPIGLDVMVPTLAAHATPHGRAGRRSFRAGDPHGRLDMSIAAGLEVCLVDEDTLALDAPDGRTLDVRVASATALLIAKAHKIHDRATGPQHRLTTKDAVDGLRIMRTHDPDEVARRACTVADEHPSFAPAVDAGAGYLRELFSSPQAAGCVMIGDNLRAVVDTTAVVSEAVAWTARFASAYTRATDPGTLS